MVWSLDFKLYLKLTLFNFADHLNAKKDSFIRSILIGLTGGALSMVHGLSFGKRLCIIFLANLCVLSLIINLNAKGEGLTKFYIYGVPYVLPYDPDLHKCGVVALAMVLHYWGLNTTLDEIVNGTHASYGRVYPSEMVRYAEELGFESQYLTGSIERLKEWIRRGWPLIVVQYFYPGDYQTHYRVVVGYDDENGMVVTYDATWGKNFNISYNNFAELWRCSYYNYTIVIAPKNNVLTSLMEEHQLSLNLQETETLRTTRNILLTALVILATYTSIITLLYMTKRKSDARKNTEHAVTKNHRDCLIEIRQKVDSPCLL